MSPPTWQASWLAPRYWATWVGFGLWYSLSWLPYAWQMQLGRALGFLFYHLAKRRRKIAKRNLDLCFPQWDELKREQTTREVMASVGMAFFETGIAWFWSHRRLKKLYKITGLEHLEKAHQEKCGVILMGLHFTHIDIGAKLLGLEFSIDGTYRPHNNPVYDFMQRRGRENSMLGQTIPRDDVRGMVKALRAGRAIWYAPDQDYGPKHSIFVPFFGQLAATITATSQLTRLGRARVIAFTQTRLPHHQGYQLNIYPPLDNFPSEDDVSDTLKINQLVEARILEQPEQYLWVHRRFKTRPPDAPDLYAQVGIKGKRP